MNEFEKAKNLISEFKGETYHYGSGSLEWIGKEVSRLGGTAVLVHAIFPGSELFVGRICDFLKNEDLELLGQVNGADPNAPREDLRRITKELISLDPDIIISFGGGSTIDATKAAEVLRTLGGEIDDYFGTNLVTRQISESGKQLRPHVAIQTAASSAAHLSKYSNITDVTTGQKKLIVDDAIIPPRSIFDYDVTLDAPPALTADGALDGISHSLEVLYGAINKPYYARVEQVAALGISLIVNHLPQVIDNPHDRKGREALCLGTDLGGYSIMLGGTNGGHLTSFSLVDILSHGRACAMLNPYYTVFFAPVIEKPLRIVGEIFKAAGFTRLDINNLNGRELGLAVAEAMMAFSERVGVPTSLAEVDGFTDSHIDRALKAAKDPQLKMKLENMPVPLTADVVDEYMGPILYAARDGNLSIIKNVY
jgi:alcohol dehydrogenase